MNWNICRPEIKRTHEILEDDSEQKIPVIFNFIDFCIKAQGAGEEIQA